MKNSRMEAHEAATLRIASLSEIDPIGDATFRPRGGTLGVQCARVVRVQCVRAFIRMASRFDSTLAPT